MTLLACQSVSANHSKLGLLRRLEVILELPDSLIKFDAETRTSRADPIADMSPQAASHTLMSDKKLQTVKMVLHWTRDPIGVSGFEKALAEYDRYAPTVFALLDRETDNEEVGAYLTDVQTERMGLSPHKKKERGFGCTPEGITRLASMTRLSAFHSIADLRSSCRNASMPNVR